MTQIHFTAISQIVLEVNGKDRPRLVETNIDIQFSKNLDDNIYFRNDGELNAEGVNAMTKTLVCGLSANIHAAHQNGVKDSAQHLREIIAELERQFIRSDAKVSEGEFKQ